MAFEKAFYLFVWTFSIVIALLKFVSSCENHPGISIEDFEVGWSFLQRMKDISDTEWIILTWVFKKYWLLLFLQIVWSNLVLRGKQKVPIIHAVYSLSCLFYMLGRTASLAFLFYIVAMYVIHLTGRKLLCYLLTMCSLFFLHNSRFFNLKEFLTLKESEMESFLFDVGFGWLLAKSLSFAVDRIDTDKHKSVSDISTILAYCLYLPAFFTGPILSYDSFCQQMLKTESASIKKVALHTLYLFYQLSLYFVYEFLLHFVYLSVIHYPDIVATFDRWAICGLGYALPMMFYLKYFTIYGTAGSIARIEGITLPPPPKCISGLHLSSFLWRHFDRGLYLWILRYLYHPLLNGGISRIYALSLSFAFVSLWHGSDLAICVWSSLNCVLVLTEIVANHVSTTKVGIFFQKLPAMMYVRFCAALATPHFIWMCISCTFFLSNYEIGTLLIQKMLWSGITPLATLAFVMYCGCHVSTSVKKFQGNNPVSVNLILDAEFEVSGALEYIDSLVKQIIRCERELKNAILYYETCAFLKVNDEDLWKPIEKRLNDLKKHLNEKLFDIDLKGSSFYHYLRN